MMKKIVISIVTLLLFAGCGIGNNDKADKEMVISQIYTLKKGDKIVKKDINATSVVKIRHTDKKEDIVVELVKGSATIVYKN